MLVISDHNTIDKSDQNERKQKSTKSTEKMEENVSITIYIFLNLLL